MPGFLHLKVEAPQSPLLSKTLEILQRELRERGQVEISDKGDASASLILAIESNIGKEGFRISHTGTSCRIAGNDGRGLLYGVGKYLRGCAYPQSGGVKHTEWSGVSVPAIDVRGIYFATHFGNFYHTAPMAAVVRYVEELALWGCNSLCVWFDMHHYTGLNDPAARQMIDRLHAILQAANHAGMGASLLMLANEAYSTSPQELRAEPFPHHYKVEICPSKNDGMELIVKWRREMLQAFADLNLEMIGIWPYDQGGCKCTDCAPWGGNGYVRNAIEVAKIAREIFPKAKTFISTWEFGYWSGELEWEQFYQAVKDKPAWADYIMAEGHGDFPPYILKNGAPGGLPLLNFPEISMSGMYPWGGFGANLQAARLQKVWNTCKKMLAGGFPYSEGIFEDINKVVCLQLYWDAEKPVRETLREYAAYEFSPLVADKMADAALALEQAMPISMEENWKERVSHASWPDQPLYKIGNATKAAETFAAADKADQILDARAKACWRWRIFWLRAALDAELSASGGKPTEKSEHYFLELAQIIHLNKGTTIFAVAAPSVNFLRSLVDQGRTSMW